MSPLRFAFQRAMLVGSFLLAACIACPASAAPPNIVMIVGDDMAWTDYGFMGHKIVQTPNLDRLARDGTVFTRGYVPFSLCRPSLLSMLTGLYPHQHKISGNDPPAGTDRSAMLKHIDRVPTLPRLLAQGGYASFQSGKWWEGSFERGGFTHGMTHGDPQRGGRHGDVGLKIGREGLQPIFDFLDQRGDQRFFIWYAPMLPHTPHNPPERLLAKYKDKVDSPTVARYYAMCEWFDETCGQLLDRLDEKGLRDNTLVVYLADNGWIQDPHGNLFAPKSKRSPYDGGVRTPIVLRWPAQLKPKRDETSLVSSIDLAPTILAACGRERTSEMLGKNLLDVAAGRTPPHETVFGATFEHNEADIDNPAASLLTRWCVNGEWKLIFPKSGNGAELYNVVADPLESKDLAAQQADRVRQLNQKLDDWWTPR